MGTTTEFKLPFPEPGDPPNVPADMKRLADATDAEIKSVRDLVRTTQLAIPQIYFGTLANLQSLGGGRWQGTMTPPPPKAPVFAMAFNATGAGSHGRAYQIISSGATATTLQFLVFKGGEAGTSGDAEVNSMAFPFAVSFWCVV